MSQAELLPALHCFEDHSHTVTFASFYILTLVGPLGFEPRTNGL